MFGCCLVIITIILSCLIVTTKDKEGCNVPIITWLFVFFIIVILMYFVTLMVICCNARNWMIQNLCWTIVFYIFILIWVIYGWTLYASEDDNCGEVEATRGWWIFFIIILSFYTAGFLLIIILLAILGCCICCMSRDDGSSVGQD